MFYGLKFVFGGYMPLLIEVRIISSKDVAENLTPVLLVGVGITELLGANITRFYS